MNYNTMTTEELVELLPSNLCIVVDDGVEKQEQWKVFNTSTGRYVEPGYDNKRVLLVNTLIRLNQWRND